MNTRDEAFITAWGSIVSDYYTKVRGKVGSYHFVAGPSSSFAWTLGSCLPSWCQNHLQKKYEYVWRLGRRYMKPRQTCYREMLLVLYRAAARDVTGGMASLNFDATQLKIVSPSNPNLRYEHFETIDFIKGSKVWSLSIYGDPWCVARSCHAPLVSRTRLPT